MIIVTTYSTLYIALIICEKYGKVLIKIWTSLYVYWKKTGVVLKVTHMQVERQGDNKIYKNNTLYFTWCGTQGMRVCCLVLGQ